MNRFLILLMQYRYLALFPLAAFEGPIVSLIAGFLVHLGYISVLPAFGILILGDIIPDSAYFLLGRYGDQQKLVKKYGGRFKIVRGGFEIAEKMWRDHPRKTMFFSKLAYGLSIPFLISAGLVKMTYMKFLEYTVPATLFQYGVLMAVGYYLGKSFEKAVGYIQYGGILIAVVLIVFIICYAIIIRYARKEIVKLEIQEK